MPNVAVVTDSCASIPEDLLESLNIQWVPYYIHCGSEVLRDLVTIQREAFYNWLPSARELPKTASPGPGDYLTMYEKLADEGVEDLVSIHMTSRGSGAYQAAVAAQAIAREMLPRLKIEVIDTLNVSMCHGWMAIEADTLKYLYMGGRIGKAKHLVGTLLNIKPLISMEDGVIVPVGTARSRSRAYKMMVDKIEAAVGSMGKIKIAYVHAAAREEAEKLRSMVEERVECVETIIAELSPALGVHTGPGTAGLCYYPVS
jgi:fatty acid-binding protein DegV